MRTRRPISINNSLAHGICNYNCRMCGVNKPGYRGPREYQPREITARLIERIREAAIQGLRIRYVANAGDGEPTVHPEFAGRMDMFGRMAASWDVPGMPAPEVSVVTNGSRLAAPGVLEALARNRITLIVSLPTPDPEAYGAIMTGDARRGAELLGQVTPGIEAAMRLAAGGRLGALHFHISPPEREIVRRDFARTLDFLAARARAAGLGALNLVLFPAAANRTGLVRSRGGGVDMFRDLFARHDRREINGVAVRMSLSFKRFFPRPGEFLDLLRSFRFPCVWNSQLFIAADGASICCNDQAVRRPMGGVLTHSLAGLIEAKEQHMPDNLCAACDQRPECMSGSLIARAFALAARARLALAGGRKRAEPAGPALPAPAAGRSRLTEAFAALGRQVMTDVHGYRFGAAGEYRIRVAADGADRLKAWGLVYRQYLEKEYARPNSRRLWYGPHDVLPETTTLLVERSGEPVATLTLVPDSPQGLPADGLYGGELAAMRARGRRPCEITSLASVEPDLCRGMEIMKHLFKLAYLTARRLTGSTDLLITVNPRHVSFYRRILLMEQQGEERACPRVNSAPAVLLGLDLATAEPRYAARYGRQSGSFYRFFIDPETEPSILKMLGENRRALDEAAVHRLLSRMQLANA
ncbi:MAG TPA: radical SAM protein [Planctomycetota bacterium]|nr:radical SAM protein [Planctomycetota bacterium]